MQDKLKRIIGVASLLLSLIIVSYLVQSYSEAITGYIGKSPFGMAIYTCIMFLITIFAPVSGIPIFPVAVHTWGPNITIILSLIGKIPASILAFVASRKYGTKFVRKIFSLEKINKSRKRMPKENSFLSLLFFRIALPMDIFNYLLGLFSSIKFKHFFFATLSSLIIYTSTISYFGNLKWETQIVIFFIGISLAIKIWKISGKREEKKT